MNIRLYSEDCLKAMKTMESESVDLIIADPDYNIGLKLDKGQVHGIKENGKKRWHGAKRGGEILKQEELENFFETFFIEAERILKPSGNIFVYFSVQEIWIIQGIMSKYFKYQNTIIWDKTTVQGEYNKKLKFMYEPILHFSKGETTINIDNIRIPRDINDKREYKTEGQNPGNIWRGQSPRGKNKITNHPTEKPKFLSERIIKMTTNPGNRVYIPFLGSGVDVDVCIELNRDCIGTDINEDYVNSTIKRNNLLSNSNKIGK